MRRRWLVLRNLRSFAVYAAQDDGFTARFALASIDMRGSGSLPEEGRRLLQTGVGLLLFCSVEGFAIPSMRAPHIALSAHTLSALQGVLLLVLGVVWPRLKLGPRVAAAAFWLLVYSAIAILAAYVIAAILGAGNETMPLTAGSAHGTALEETVIKVVAYSSAPTGLIAFGLILWGLRTASAPARSR